MPSTSVATAQVTQIDRYIEIPAKGCKSQGSLKRKARRQEEGKRRRSKLPGPRRSFVCLRMYYDWLVYAKKE